MNIDICVITPSYNQAPFIERTINSVLEQKNVQLDYVIFDGGSMDGTLSILDRYKDRIRIVSEPDKGQAHAVNKGITTTTAPIIGWLNSDDIYYPDTLRAVCDFFAAHPEIDVVYGNALWIDAIDTIIGPYPVAPWDAKVLLQECILCQPAVFFRRRVVDRVGMLDESLHYCMDYEYWIRCMRADIQCAHVSSVWAASRVYPETKTESGKVPAYFEAVSMLRKHVGYVPDQWLLWYPKALFLSRGWQDKSIVFYLAYPFLLCVTLMRLQQWPTWQLLKRLSYKLISY